MNSGFFGKGHVSHDKRFTNPRRDWFIGLLLFLLVVGAGGAYSAHMFVTYRSLNTDGGDYEESLVRYNENLIQEVLGVYQERKVNFDALRNVRTQVVLPPVVVVSSSTASTSQEVLQESEPLPSDGDLDEVELVN